MQTVLSISLFKVHRSGKINRGLHPVRNVVNCVVRSVFDSRGFSAECVTTWPNIVDCVLWLASCGPPDLAVAVKGVQGVVAGRMRKVAQLVQMLLSLPDVPVKAFGQGIEPIGDLIGRTNTRHRVNGRGHS